MIGSFPFCLLSVVVFRAIFDSFPFAALLAFSILAEI